MVVKLHKLVISRTVMTILPIPISFPSYPSIIFSMGMDRKSPMSCPTMLFNPVIRFEKGSTKQIQVCRFERMTN